MATGPSTTSEPAGRRASERGDGTGGSPEPEEDAGPGVLVCAGDAAADAAAAEFGTAAADAELEGGSATNEEL